ncbi:MAG: ATPase [Verrucomicrobiales bacterium]|nr:ATPase [Verrucomicrobiales bacterium]
MLETVSIRTQQSHGEQCFHCGEPVGKARFAYESKAFCCNGCLTVFQLLTENGLEDFYSMSDAAGVRITAPVGDGQFAYLDDGAVRGKLVDYSDDKITRVTFRAPAIHCVACVWLLENLFRLKPGIAEARVRFLQKEVAITFDTGRIKLSEVVALLASLGYEPELKLSDLERKQSSPTSRRLWMQIGFAGFAFGNIMLMSLSSYFGLDAFEAARFKPLFGFISLALVLPVVFYSATDYWKTAWRSVQQRSISLDIPIAVGIAALFAQSVYDVIGGRGDSYFDSLAGLLFFLLSGKLFQQKIFDRLAFDRDYKSFFPLSVTRCDGEREEQCSLSQLRVGDRLVLRHGELIPADARLVGGAAVVDYSFVTGESAPVEKNIGEHLFAGGRQMGGTIEIQTVKEVSQSYLTSLWNQKPFQKEKNGTLETLTNQYSRRFTKVVFGIAIAAGLFWSLSSSAKAINAFTAVLIVACPCALALAAPFALGTAQRLLARRNIYLKNTGVLETLARVDHVVFDKTGTLTASGAGEVRISGVQLTAQEQQWVAALAHDSTHPYATRISETMPGSNATVRSFSETAGCGITGTVSGTRVHMGSRMWLEQNAISVPPNNEAGSHVHVAIGSVYRCTFILTSALRPQTAQMIRRLGHNATLLSGDNEKERGMFAPVFGGAEMRFNQSPHDKLSYITELQANGRTVMMVGDGLNDAGALNQSDVGVAVVENVNAFSPASDVIVSGDVVPRLDKVLQFSKQCVRIVRWSFVVSGLYNVVGLAIAARAELSPVICAVLMPLSSLTVVLFACGAVTVAARNLRENTTADRPLEISADKAVRAPVRIFAEAAQ